MRVAPSLLALLIAVACSSSSTGPAGRDVVAASHATSQRIAGSVVLAPPRGPIALEPVQVIPRAHDLEGVERVVLKRTVRQEPERLGPASVGHPNRGWLINGVQLKSGPFWEVIDEDRSWGTPETIGGIQRAIMAVQERFPGSPRLMVGDISRQRGGHLRPHRSHQSGRDVDIGYYYKHGEDWYERATAETLDVARTWALVRGLLAECDTEYIFMDRGVQNLLHEHALSIGEDPEWVESLFQRRRRGPGVIRHTWGHRTHMHVRFYSNLATRAGELALTGAARR